tara:strand:+ start:591 stop:731 length:141 start_codon:yes stop_codon:yes gene_type:complete
MQGKVYAILIYLPESTAVKNGNILGKNNKKNINLRFNFEIYLFVID